MSTEWMDNMLGGKINKEAMDAQGKDAADHFERKVKAHDWIKGVSELDPEAVEKEFLAAQAAEAKLLGKTAAYEQGDSVEETLKKDYRKAVEILSDYALAEIVAGIRGHAEQNTPEMFSSHKEDAKKEIASNRKKVEEEVLKATGMSAQIDWKKEFARYSKEATPEQPKEKDLYSPEVPEKKVSFDSPSENKFKLPTKEEMVPAGNGREADERQEVTKQAVPVIKEASIEKKAHCGMDHSAEPVSPLKREELPAEVKAEEIDGCPICGGIGEDLGTLGERDHLRCRMCGINYSHKTGKCAKCGSVDEIQSQASKADVIAKVAELSKKSEVASPWAIIKDENGQDVIARIEQPKNEKVSEDKKDEEIQK